MLKLQLLLSVNNTPIWMDSLNVSDKLNHKFTNDELQEALMAAEDHLAGIAKNKETKIRTLKEKGDKNSTTSNGEG